MDEELLKYEEKNNEYQRQIGTSAGKRKYLSQTIPNKKEKLISEENQ